MRRLAAGLAAATMAVSAHAAPAAKSPPLAADGHPDLSAVWTNAEYHRMGAGAVLFTESQAAVMRATSSGDRCLTAGIARP